MQQQQKSPPAYGGMVSSSNNFNATTEIQSNPQHQQKKQDTYRTQTKENP
jgi:hypothetical protein